MTIFLHIGLNKTGSSSVQKFCRLQRVVLRNHGLEYPEVGIHDSAHYGVSKLLMGKPPQVEAAPADGLEETIRSALANRSHVLISSEYFFLATDQQVLGIRDFLEKFRTDTRIIVYLRRHDLWIASLFNQALKNAPKYAPWHSDIREFTIHLLGSSKFELRYPVILDRWAGQFGTENIIVRPFESRQFRMEEYLWDFLMSIDTGLPGALIDKGISPLRTNESLPEDLLRTIGYIKSSNISTDAKNRITALLVQANSPPEAAKSADQAWDTRSFVLAPYLRRSIVRRFSDDYAYIARRYLGSPDGVLFREKVR